MGTQDPINLQNSIIISKSELLHFYLPKLGEQGLKMYFVYIVYILIYCQNLLLLGLCWMNCDIEKIWLCNS